MAHQTRIERAMGMGYEPSCPKSLAGILVDITEYLEAREIPYQSYLREASSILRMFERYLIRRRRFRMAYDCAWLVLRIHEVGSLAEVQVELQRGIAERKEGQTHE